MEKMIEMCSADWYLGKCRLSKEIKGWGCRLLTCLPDENIVTETEQAIMFGKIYSHAKNMGVTECKHFCHSCIETSLKDKEMIRQMLLLNQPLRADLLSENFEESYM